MKEEFINFVPIENLQEADFWYVSDDEGIIETTKHNHAVARIDIVSIDRTAMTVKTSRVLIGEDNSTEDEFPYYEDDEYYGIWRMTVSDEEIAEAKHELEKWLTN